VPPQASGTLCRGQTARGALRGRQVQLAFPDLTRAQSAVLRVFAVLDRASKIDPGAAGALAARGHAALGGRTACMPVLEQMQPRPCGRAHARHRQGPPRAGGRPLCLPAARGGAGVRGAVARRAARRVACAGRDVRQRQVRWPARPARVLSVSAAAAAAAWSAATCCTPRRSSLLCFIMCFTLEAIIP